VFVKGETVGGIIARYNSDYSKLHIYNIFVNPNYQNCGIGKALINQLYKDAQIHGTDYICTLNNSINKYFEKQNFVKGKIYLWHKLHPFNCQKDINMI
jgi:ribosomal protein S18 acetylase RimI-like enzyme